MAVSKPIAIGVSLVSLLQRSLIFVYSPRTARLQVLLSLLYIPSTYLYSNLAFHLRPLPLPFSDPSFTSESSFPSSPSLRSTTLRSPSSTPYYDRLAFCEDSVTHRLEDGREVGIASCDPTRWEWNTVMGTLVNPKVGKGAFWLINPIETLAKRIKLEWKELEEDQVDFHPLGIDIHSSNRVDYLFSTNHQANKSTIEIFTLECTNSDCTAHHLRTLSHPSFTGAPNSIAVSSPTSFYLSHDHQFTLRNPSRLNKLLNSIETIFALPLSSVDHISFSFDSNEINVSRAVSNIAFANGIALSPSGQTLVVASTTTRSVRFYSRNLDMNEISRRPYRTVKLPFLVDNLSFAPRDFFGPSNRVKNPKHTSSQSSFDDSFTSIVTGHPSFPSLLSTAHRKPLTLLPLLQHLSFLPSPLIAPLNTFVKRWSFDWRESRGMSWSVSIPHPPLASKEEWENLFRSSGKGDEGFGSSSTGIVGKNEVDGNVKRWMIVVGLYEEGVRVVVED